MQFDIRAARQEEMADYRAIVRYVFAVNGRPSEQGDEDIGPMRPEWTTCAFVDGQMAATMGAFPFHMYWNGREVPVAGITNVGTAPEHRRRGLLRAIVEQGFREQRERGQSLALLWASFGAIYQRFGYGLASDVVQFNFDPRDVTLRDSTPAVGAVRRVARDAATPQLEQVYAAFAAGRNLLLRREPEMWAYRLRDREDRQTNVAVYTAGDGRPSGSMIYSAVEDERFGEPSPVQDMEVHDFVAADLDAFRGLWAFIRSHDLVRRVTMTTSEDDPAPLLVLEPRALRRRSGDAIWMRVVDVERALVLRPYEEAGSLRLEIRDELCEWNDGRYHLESGGDDSKVSRTAAEPQLRMPASSLATLAGGYRTASQLARAGLLEALDPSALALADRMFATAYRPYCADGF